MLQNYVVHKGNKRFVMISGLPQGGCLSSLLCDIYYSDLDTTHLREFINDEDLLLRAVDDYLFITTHMDRAAKYVRR
jgi:telomerase reverse transcriptase